MTYMTYTVRNSSVSRRKAMAFIILMIRSVFNGFHIIIVFERLMYELLKEIL